MTEKDNVKNEGGFGYPLLCDVCEDDSKTVAVTVNGINVCHNCIDFFKSLGKCNNRGVQEELYFQVNYINNRRK